MIPNTSFLSELNPTQKSLSIVGSKIKCCRDSYEVYGILTHTRTNVNEATGVPADTATGPEHFFIWKIGGNPWRNVFCRYRKGLALPHMSTGTGRGDREEIGVPVETAAAPEFFRNFENRGDP